MEKYKILHGNTFPIVEYHLARGEKIFAESDAMVAMDTTIDVRGKMRGGLLSGLARTFLTDESFFLQELVAERGSGRVYFAPALPGGIMDISLDGSYELAVQKGGFLAATDGISVSTKTENLLKSFFSGLGLFVLKASGTGTVFVNSWGAVHLVELQDGEEIVVDNGHILAWPTHMSYSIQKASGSWFSSITSGEALVCRFTGPGTILIQTRNINSFTGWVQGIAKQLLTKK